MAYTIQNTTHPCWATFPCSHKRKNLCTYWIKVGVVVGKWAEDDPENRNCYQSMIDTDREPCLDMTAEEREQGIPDIFGLNLEP